MVGGSCMIAPSTTRSCMHPLHRSEVDPCPLVRTGEADHAFAIPACSSHATALACTSAVCS